MEHEILRSLGQIAGVAGVGLGVFLILYRDVIRKTIFPNLTKRQGFLIIVLFLVLVWSVAITGIVAWIWVSTHVPQNYDREPEPLEPTAENWPFAIAEAKQRQYNTAQELELPVTKVVELHNNVEMRFVLIPAGEFLMGSHLSPDDTEQRFGGIAEHYKHEHPRHTVWISRPFYVTATEVTRQHFAVFVEATGYQTEAEREGFSIVWNGTWIPKRGASWKSAGFKQTDNHPAVNLSWNDAAAFCDWLAERINARCRLPTEAEWEYACRAGTDTAFQWGDDPDDGKGWCNAADLTALRANPTWNCFNWDDGYLYTSPVGSFRPNAWGLYDMHGNVWEWCYDSYSPNYYDESQVTAPQGPTDGGRRVLRGGSWFRGPRLCRSACRNTRNPAGRSYMTSFRVVFDCPYEAQAPAGPYGEEEKLLDGPARHGPSLPDSGASGSDSFQNESAFLDGSTWRTSCQ